jgi:hypothetical protein
MPNYCVKFTFMGINANHMVNAGIIKLLNCFAQLLIDDFALID